MKQLRLVLALVAVVSVAACGGKGDDGSGDSCEKVGERFAALAHAEADDLPDDHPQKAEAMALLAVLPKARASVVKECREEKWSPAIRGCFMEAKNAAEFRDKCKDLMGTDTTAKPASDEPAGDQPAADEPAADEPANDEPANDEPAADQPAAEGETD